MFNIHINKNSRKQQAIWKNLHGTPEQPTSVECGYYVMRFMRDIIHDPDLNFEKKVKRNILDILSLFYYVIFLFNRRLYSFNTSVFWFILQFDKKKDKLQYTQKDIDEVRHEWAEFVNKQLPKDN